MVLAYILSYRLAVGLRIGITPTTLGDYKLLKSVILYISPLLVIQLQFELYLLP